MEARSAGLSGAFEYEARRLVATLPPKQASAPAAYAEHSGIGSKRRLPASQAQSTIRIPKGTPTRHTIRSAAPDARETLTFPTFESRFPMAFPESLMSSSAAKIAPMASTPARPSARFGFRPSRDRCARGR